MRHYWFNRQKLLQKAEEKYHNCGGKEKSAEFYQTKEDVIKEKANNKYKSLTEEEKEAKTQYSKNRYQKMKKK